MPRIVRLFISQGMIGAGLATVFVAFLLALDVGRLWHLVTHTLVGPFAVFLLWVHFAAVFACVQFGISVMRLGDAKEDWPGPGGGTPQPVRVASAERHGRAMAGKRTAGRPG